MEPSQNYQDYTIELARSHDHLVLTKIALDSKALWGYPKEWLAEWTDDLTIHPEYIDQHYVFVVRQKNQNEICGFCALEWYREDKYIEVAHMWIRPEYVNRKLGGWLLNTARQYVDSLPFERIIAVSDPNAVGFYERMGFKATGSFEESTPPGRRLPVMEMIPGE